ncbi:MAG: outer membrane protein transport protein [Verrucomicrobiota bacterium]|jgi:long-chain fatty acid transport protein
MITNRSHTSGVLAVLISGVSAGSVSADGFRLASQDAFATARGEAFVATADNASAIYYNPAGITQLEGVNFRGGVYGIYLDPTFSPPSTAANSGSTYHIEHQWAAVPQGFATYTPEEWPLSFGLGVYAPYGGNMEWPQSTGFREVATGAALNYVTINPVLALKLAPGLSIAGGAMANYANLVMEQGIRTNNTGLFVGSSRFRGEGWSAGYNVGLLWQPYEEVSLGATFRSRATVRLNGKTDLEAPPTTFGDVQRSAQADFEFPMTTVFGISYRPTPKWNVEIDADYTDWSSFGQTTIYQSPIPPQQIFLKRLNPPTNVAVTLDWQPTWMYEFGVTRYFEKGWHVSAGYVYSENAVPNAYYTPLAADLARQFFSVGAGRKGRHLDFDITYQFGYGPAHTVTGSAPSSDPIPSFYSGQTANGTYNFISHAVFLTVGLHF